MVASCPSTILRSILLLACLSYLFRDDLLDLLSCMEKFYVSFCYMELPVPSDTGLTFI